MLNLECRSCGSKSYSAAPASIVESGARCEVCGGPICEIRNAGAGLHPAPAVRILHERDGA